MQSPVLSRAASRVSCFLRGRQQCRDNLSPRDFDLIRPSERYRGRNVFRARVISIELCYVVAWCESAVQATPLVYYSPVQRAGTKPWRIVPTTARILLL